MNESLGKSVPLDEIERSVVAMAIKSAVTRGDVKSFEAFEGLKSALSKIGFSAQEVEILKARGREKQAAQAAPKLEKLA